MVVDIWVVVDIQEAIMACLVEVVEVTMGHLCLLRGQLMVGVVDITLVMMLLLLLLLLGMVDILLVDKGMLIHMALLLLELIRIMLNIMQQQPRRGTELRLRGIHLRRRHLLVVMVVQLRHCHLRRRHLQMRWRRHRRRHHRRRVGSPFYRHHLRQLLVLLEAMLVLLEESMSVLWLKCKLRCLERKWGC